MLLTTVPPLQHPPKPLLNINFLLSCQPYPERLRNGLWLYATCDTPMGTLSDSGSWWPVASWEMEDYMSKDWSGAWILTWSLFGFIFKSLFLYIVHKPCQLTKPMLCSCIEMMWLLREAEFEIQKMNERHQWTLISTNRVTATLMTWSRS